MLQLHPDDLEWSAIRAQGAGGQHVNKVASAVHLRYNIHRAQLPLAVKERLLCLTDQRISQNGVVVIKAQSSRSQTMNKAEALERLQALVNSAAHAPKPRKATRPSRSAQRQRMEGKAQRSAVKAQRSRVTSDAA